MVVLPWGVMPRFLYSVAAIVVAFLLVAERPTGEGLSDAEAYRRQGMYAQLSTYAEDPYRWRSLTRWTSLACEWWLSWSGDALSSLLIGFLERAGGRDVDEMVRVAVDGHVQWGGTW